MDLRNIVKQSNTVIIDVREPYEFAAGHAVGAINIPLGTIPTSLIDIKKMGNPVVVYCRSGMRSANAMSFLKAQGVQDIFNGGSLDEVLMYQKKAA
ncbi:MAG: rhodanese-like domain-containing protein [Saprospiraceae bacterium]